MYWHWNLARGEVFAGGDPQGEGELAGLGGDLAGLLGDLLSTVSSSDVSEGRHREHAKWQPFTCKHKFAVTHSPLVTRSYKIWFRSCHGFQI